ncbi:type I-F CRISPR-associated helicase Cas3f [Shewanella sp. KJ2020]|uniref:type I-F CRISPR-associated helicase Cas3f n=1 Tax=Shewanella sp. KJ2020 TaxID=2919172 RepID=UPI0020A6E1B7|nr:type I-F CRISPR-associated helicase Cas3f [Shewanella sp. KJ2020]MCP3128803.1 type I-F CRISPR-associated helicase Cas3f [Shewanella sp. KJ2020]
MMVTFISQCEKNALKKTRRVLDAFANRIGDNTWQTLITEDGLLTVKKMLKQTASRSTAVSCHWIRSRSRTQLLWIVGNRLKFNEQGIVPVNRTQLNLEHKEWEQGWHLNEVIVLASSIAGLFHDFGKANDLFQLKLKGLTESKGEPYRHEWVSLRLFEAFANGLADKDWLEKLANIDKNSTEIEQQVLSRLFKEDSGYQRPFDQLAPFAKLVAWLIVSHHRLPLAHVGSVHTKEIDSWLSHCFSCHWNSANAENMTAIDTDLIRQNWQFSQGTPLLSRPWQHKARNLSERALNCPLIFTEQVWLEQRFVGHMARLSLMLADHYYSSLPAEKSKVQWRDKTYNAFANTDHKRLPQAGNALKQQLDEHNIGVAVNAQRFAQNLPALKYTLPAIAQHKLFSQNATNAKYRWQDKAFAQAKLIAKGSERQGFFGVNMASTGCGKTIASARIMYGLADEREGCRFSVALGLRTLTLQTGDAYRDLLKLGDDELAVLIGSQAVSTLHQLNNATPQHKQIGSESAEDLFEQLFISYQGQIYDGRLKHWLAACPKLEQLVSAPILVSTIDHLMPATESLRGGKQIAPMLRLLTSDLILDEPDDFGLEDLPALCRLVNWAGMLGSRVLLSSATLPPSLIKTLFDAYHAGRQHFNQAHFATTEQPPIWCAWFDEYKSETLEISNSRSYIEQHKIFVSKRVKKLACQQVVRRGELVKLELASPTTLDECVASMLHRCLHQLHDMHHVVHPSGRKVSLGVVRMANINPMIAVAKLLINMSPQADYSIHYCVYHSQFPLAHRSYKESRLDNALSRHDEANLWRQPEIQQALSMTNTSNNIFIVLGTSVVEVGRDHDYDWAIAEPSSLRALIQLAGRIQRHRQQVPKTANLLVLNKNIRALKNEHPAYCKPGFESAALPLLQHDLTQLLTTELDAISAIPRIMEPVPSANGSEFQYSDLHKKQHAQAVNSFWGQEHRALQLALGPVGKDKAGVIFYRSYKEANLWWKHDVSWSGEFIRQTAFRQSQPQEAFLLRLPEDEILTWCQLDTTHKPYQYPTLNHRFNSEIVPLAKGCFWWFNPSTEQIYQDLADLLDSSITKVSEQFGEINLRMANKDQPALEWAWHEQLGVYECKDNKDSPWN